MSLVNQTISHYKIVSHIGAGGMGEVYLAEDTRLHRKVALKILPADLASNQDRIRRFEQEAKAAAALNHPNIATIHEIGESDGVNFIGYRQLNSTRNKISVVGDRNARFVIWLINDRLDANGLIP